MKILFENVTKYSKSSYKAYLDFHEKKFKIKNIFKISLITIFFILIMILCFIFSFFYLAFLLLIIFIILFICNYTYYKKLIKKEFESDKIKHEQKFIFTFYKYYFLVSDGTNKKSINYWSLYRIFENQSFFYLYLDKTHSFLISKNGFSKGTSSDFFKFIKRKIRFKFL